MLDVETVILPQSLENSSQVSISFEPINIFIPQLLLIMLYDAVNARMLGDRPTVIILSNLSILGIFPNSSRIK